MLIDVSKWFGQPMKFNPDFIVAVFQAHDKPRTFCIATLTDSAEDAWRSKEFEDAKICEYEMEQFCKKIEDNI